MAFSASTSDGVGATDVVSEGGRACPLSAKIHRRNEIVFIDT